MAIEYAYEVKDLGPEHAQYFRGYCGTDHYRHYVGCGESYNDGLEMAVDMMAAEFNGDGHGKLEELMDDIYNNNVLDEIENLAKGNPHESCDSDDDGNCVEYCEWQYYVVVVVRKYDVTYEDVVFLQGDEAEEPLELLDEDGEEAALRYLKDWHSPGEHDVRQALPHGEMDYSYESGDYIMGYSLRLGYVGLVYKCVEELVD